MIVNKKRVKRGLIEKKKGVPCAYCGDVIISKFRCHIHVNRLSSSPVNYFCSEDCKKKWIGFKQGELM